MPKNNDEEEMPDDELSDELGVPILPSMRIYVTLHTPDGNELETYQFMDYCGEKGVAGVIRDFMDNGIANVYYCNFNVIDKVL